MNNIDHLVDEPRNVQQLRVFRRFTLTQFAEDFDKPIAAHLVKGVLQQGGLGLLIGQEKSGKSFVLLELAAYIAAGKEDWHGRRIAKACRAATVVYISGEGAAGFRQRKKALAKHLGLSLQQLASMPFFDIQVAPNLSDPKTLNDLIHDIGLIGKPVLIVIDTLARTIFGDENDSEVMTQYVENCSAIQRSFGCAVLIVHHIPKSSQSGPRGLVTPRGSNVLPACVDSCLKIDLKDNGEKHLDVFFAKDLECSTIMNFKLKQLAVGVDDEGEKVTSCVIEEVGTETTPERYAAASNGGGDGWQWRE